MDCVSDVIFAALGIKEWREMLPCVKKPMHSSALVSRAQALNLPVHDPRHYSEYLSNEALLIAIRCLGPELLLPSELISVEGVSPRIRETLRDACTLLCCRPEFSDVEHAAPDRPSSARWLHRLRLLRRQHCLASAISIGSLGLNRRVALAKDGQVFTTTESMPSATTSWSSIAGPVVEADAALDNSLQIQSLCMSPFALLAVDAAGRVMLAEKSEEKTLRFSLVPALKGVKASGVFSRFGQIYVVACTGEVYSWGMDSGDLTLERNCPMGSPAFGKLNFGAASVRSVACGAAHAVFTCQTGAAFSIGQGEQGQLGYGGFGDKSSPVPMVLPEHAKVRSAACGMRHTLLVLTSGEALGCGGVHANELPIRKLSPGVLRPSQTAEGFTKFAFEAIPRNLDLLPADFFVTGVACGVNSSFFLGDIGNVLFTGIVIGDPAPFGRSRGADPKIPHKIPHLPRISEVSVSLSVPLKIPGPGVSIVALPAASESQPIEAALFRAADEPRVFLWGSPGGDRPQELHV